MREAPHRSKGTVLDAKAADVITREGKGSAVTRRRTPPCSAPAAPCPPDPPGDSKSGFGPARVQQADKLSWGFPGVGGARTAVSSKAA